MSEHQQTGVAPAAEAAEAAASRTIDDVETLRAMADPTRMKILDALMTPQHGELPVMSAKDLAGALGESQTKLYRHIRQLEEELGITLFVRHRQGVKLTEAGSGLLEKAKVLAAAASDFYETAGQTSRSEANRVRVGIHAGLQRLRRALEVLDVRRALHPEPALRRQRQAVGNALPRERRRGTGENHEPLANSVSHTSPR